MLVQFSSSDWSLQVLKRPQVWEVFGKVPGLMNRHIVLPALELCTPAGPLRLVNFNIWIDETDPDITLTVGIPVMQAMGYSTLGLLKEAQLVSSTLDLSHLSVTDQGESSAVHKALKLRSLRRASVDREFDEVEDVDDDDDVVVPPAMADEAVAEALQARVAEALADGISVKGRDRLVVVSTRCN